MKSNVVIIIASLLSLFTIACQPIPANEETGEKQVEKQVSFSSVSVGAITTEAATFSASVSASGVSSSIIAYFYYAESATSLGKSDGKKSKESILPSSGGQFTQTVTGLKKATTYYYAAAVTVDGEEKLSAISSFETENVPSEAHTGDASGITETSAVLGGSATITGDMATTKFGIQYSTASDNSFSQGKYEYAKALDSAGEFTVSIEGLTEGTEYAYRAFVLENNDFSYGDVRTFTTKEASKVYTLNAEDIDIRKATLKVSFLNNSTTTNVTVGICISESFNNADDLYSQGDKTETQTTYTKGTYTVNYNLLDGQTSYYYVGYAIIGGDTIFGEVKQFRTKDLAGNVIEYTTTDGNPSGLHGELGEGVLLVSNSYSGSVCKVVLNNPVEYMSGTFYKETTVKTVKIPEFTEWIEEAFEGCTSLEAVSIPESVTAIGMFSFYNCSSLKEVTLPSKLTQILKSAFNGCSSLEEITLPATVNKLGGYVFESCPSLNSITILATTPPTLSENLFYNSTKRPTIYVPSASVDAYKSANIWSNYADSIVGF